MTERQKNPKLLPAFPCLMLQASYEGCCQTIVIC